MQQFCRMCKVIQKVKDNYSQAKRLPLNCFKRKKEENQKEK